MIHIRFIVIFLVFQQSILWCVNPSDFGPPLIKLAYYEFAPFYYDEKGMDKDIVDETVRKTGIQIETQVMKRARIWADLESGDLMMATSGIPTPEREKFAWFVPYIIMKNKAILRLAVTGQVKNADDFYRDSQLRFAAVNSFKHGEEQDCFLEKMKTVKRINIVPDVRTLFLQLKDGRSDGLFAHSPVYSHYLKELKMENMVQVEDWTPDEKGVIGALIFSKKHFTGEQINNWKKMVLAMKKEGALEKILENYMSREDAHKAMDFN
jgi:polar amino acid transport system substrate-binding protein